MFRSNHILTKLEYIFFQAPRFAGHWWIVALAAPYWVSRNCSTTWNGIAQDERKVTLLIKPLSRNGAGTIVVGDVRITRKHSLLLTAPSGLPWSINHDQCWVSVLNMELWGVRYQWEYMIQQEIASRTWFASSLLIAGNRWHRASIWGRFVASVCPSDNKSP